MNNSRLSNALDQMKNNLLQQQIITMTLNPNNIVTIHHEGTENTECVR